MAIKTPEEILESNLATQYMNSGFKNQIVRAMEEYKNQFIDFDGPLAMAEHYRKLAGWWEDAHAKLEEKLRGKHVAELRAFDEDLNKAIGRAYALEEWLTEYRDQLLKHSEGNPIASKRNKYVINDINELLNENT